MVNKEKVKSLERDFSRAKNQHEKFKRIIELWIQRNPQEAAEFQQALKMKRAEMRANMNRFGETEDKGASRRMVMMIPPKLDQAFKRLDENYDGSMEKGAENQIKKMRKFLREFPMFQVPERL